MVDDLKTVEGVWNQKNHRHTDWTSCCL